MNLLLLFPEDQQTEDRFVVTGSRAMHLIQILNVQKETILHIGMQNGPTGRAIVTRVTPHSVELEATLNQRSNPRPSTRLIMGIPRPKVLKRLIPQLVCFGLDELVLLRTWRVERSYLHSAYLHPEQLRPLVWEGLMQGCITHEPNIRVEPRFLPYVEEHLAPVSSSSLRWVAHPRADKHLSEISFHGANNTTIAIGPERGFLDEEVDSLIQVGFVPARIAGPILRVDTACIAALAQLELRLAQLSSQKPIEN